jgi:CBS domain-containing protein
VHAEAQKEAAAMKLQDVMTTPVASVPPDRSLRTVAKELAERHISGMPVVDGDGEVVGVISAADLVSREAGAAPRRTLLGRFSRRGEPDATARRRTELVSEAMTTPAITMAPDRSVASAARTMLARGIHRIPVVEQGKLVGIVTGTDLVRAFARPADLVSFAVRSQIRYRLALAHDPGPVEVVIDEDGLTLRGTVIRRSTVAGLIEAAADVPGAVDVHSELGWLEDDSRPAGATERRASI